MVKYNTDPRIVVQNFYFLFFESPHIVKLVAQKNFGFGPSTWAWRLILRFFSSNIGNLRNQESCHNAWLVQLSWIIFSPIMSLLGVHVLKKKKFQISKILLNKIFQNSDFQKRSKKSACLHPEGQFFSTMGKLTT